MIDLPPHGLELALVSPRIPQNVGNVARTCVATGTRLHLVHPLGFVLNDRRARRAGLDYWPRLKLCEHDGLNAFLAETSGRRRWWFDSAGTVGLFDANFADGDLLVLGSETRGLPPGLLAADASNAVRIPQAPGERCLNLATSAGIALYTALSRVAMAGR